MLRIVYPGQVPSGVVVRRVGKLLGLCVGAVLVAGTATGCAQRLKGRDLRFHSAKDVEASPEKQEGGRAVTSPSRRASSARPKGYEDGHQPLDSDRTGGAAYRVFIQRIEQERRRRYGPPSRKKRKSKARK